MILQRISDHLKQRRRDSIHDMAQTLNTSPDALRNMLAILERKGLVQRLPSGTPCGGGCCQCRPETIEIYDWVGSARDN
ncbi:MAG: sugar metabolism transcriptional regulator [Oxalobacter sp.]|nr:MAG: sugar metabolism transcriptional regulator [Oxalobacter sp.]